MSQASKLCALLILRRDDEVLLAMKKRDFGKGYWNGVGGKIMPDETVEQGMVRECQEEIGVTPTSYTKVALHDFVFPDGTADMLVHAFVADQWEGEPTESEEMAPKWFDIKDIPYDQMWQDDQLWLPLVLKGNKLNCRFVFDQDNNMQAAQLTLVDDLR